MNEIMHIEEEKRAQQSCEKFLFSFHGVLLSFVNKLLIFVELREHNLNLHA